MYSKIMLNGLNTQAGTLDPIPVHQFASHVVLMHSNDDYLFSEEYSVSDVISRRRACSRYYLIIEIGAKTCTHM